MELRERRRYILFELFGEVPEFEELKKAIYESILKLGGEIGFSIANPMLLEEPRSERKYLLKVSHKHVNLAKLALSITRKVNNKEVILKSIKVFGTIKKSKPFFKS